MNSNNKGKKIIIAGFIVAVLFFLGAIGFAVYTFLKGDIFISSSNIDVTFLGPDEIESGQEVEVTVQIYNNNNTTLKNVDLIVNYPEGARELNDLSKKLNRVRLEVGDVGVRQQAEVNLSFILFGDEGLNQRLFFELEYGVERSNARYTHQSDYDILIGSSPISISVSSLRDIYAGQDAEFFVKIDSYSSEVLKNVVLIAEYPSGFTPREFSVEPDRDNSEWIFTDFEANERKEISLKGFFEGDAGQERTVRFSVGVLDDNNRLMAIYSSDSYSAILRSPQLVLKSSLSGRTGDITISPLGVVEGVIRVRNGLSVEIKDVEIQIDLGDKIIDPDSIQTRRGGFFDPNNNLLIWSHIDQTRLAEIPAGREEIFEFSFSFLDSSVLRNLPEPSELITTRVTARQTREEGVSENLQSTVRQNIELSTTAGVSSRGLYSIGPFNNSGLLPPRVGEPTTYTVVLGLTSSVNDLRDVEVTATLPDFVEWMGMTAPDGVNIRYSESSRQITWRLNRLEAGRGFERSPLEAAFQVSYVPRIPHRGSSRSIVENISIRGIDSFTEEVITAKGSNITTLIDSDPAFTFGQERVQ